MTESSVRISTSKGLFTADLVLVTLPLGVLKSNSVTFSPPLPQRKQLAIRRLGFGTMVKVILYFPTCFWPRDMHFINFLPIPSSIPNPKLCSHLNGRQMKALTTYMNTLANYTSLVPVHGTPVLIGYMVNDSAEAFETLTEQEAMQVLVCQLSHYFDVLARDPLTFGPTRVFMTRWNADPYARGSYTSIPVGAHQSDLAEFETPVGARSVVVSTAGEHHEHYKTEACIDELAIKAGRHGHGATQNLQNTHACLSEKSGDQGIYRINLTATAYRLMNGTDGSNDEQHNGRHGNKMHRTCSLFKSILALGSFARTNSVNVEKRVNPNRAVARDQAVTTQDNHPCAHACGKGHQHSQSQLSTTPHLSEKKKEAIVTNIIAVDDDARGRIHFAGEHTTPTSFASVHGALMTGRREAAKIVAQIHQL